MEHIVFTANLIATALLLFGCAVAIRHVTGGIADFLERKPTSNNKTVTAETRKESRK